MAELTPRRLGAACAAAFFLAVPTLALAQGAVQQCGALTAGHPTMYAGNGCVMDAGGVRLGWLGAAERGDKDAIAAAVIDIAGAVPRAHD
jgi:hypothetical protein